MPITTTPVPQTKSDGTLLPLYDEFHERAVQWGACGQPPVVFYGDSITANWVACGKGLTVWREHFAALPAINLGFSGNKTQNTLWELRNGHCGKMTPQAAVLLIGTNNLGNTAGDMLAGVQACVQEIQTQFLGARILLHTIFPRDVNATYWPKIQSVNDGIALMDNGDTLRVLRLWDEWLLNGALNASLFLDYLHPNTAGYLMWAGAMEPLLVEMLGS